MEKEINKFKDTAVVVIKDKPPRTRLEELLQMFPSDNYFTYLPEEFCYIFTPEYSICYDLYINGVKVDGDYLLVDDGDRILEAKTYREITEEDIKNFLG